MSWAGPGRSVCYCQCLLVLQDVAKELSAEWDVQRPWAWSLSGAENPDETSVDFVWRQSISLCLSHLALFMPSGPGCVMGPVECVVTCARPHLLGSEVGLLVQVCATWGFVSNGAEYRSSTVWDKGESTSRILVQKYQVISTFRVEHASVPSVCVVCLGLSETWQCQDWFCGCQVKQLAAVLPPGEWKPLLLGLGRALNSCYYGHSFSKS